MSDSHHPWDETVNPSPPPQYARLDEEELFARIEKLRERLGTELLILAHHYVQDGVFRFADHTGDSYGLAKVAAKVEAARFILFAGVHFMAEAADILTPPDKVVVMPDPTAGCPLADFANLEQVEQAWEAIEECTRDKVVPITYVNSGADLKAFVGRHDGAVCTSSNARKIIEWALSQGQKTFFFPDQHLGRNTCYEMGIPLDQSLLWDPALDYGGHSQKAIASAKVLLWKGHCHVHQAFTTEQVAAWRAERPQIKVIVHPECTFEVVRASDLNGSTSFIIEQLRQAPPGSEWAIGTEAHLVNRLRNQLPELFITSLAKRSTLCVNMHRNRPHHLLWLLENLAEGRVINRVSVNEEVARWARVGLERMLEITGPS